MKPRRILIAAACVIALVVVAVGIAVASFDPNSLKPRIEAAARRATGRDLTLNGKIVLKASLWPTIEASDVAFSNPPGFSRPQMATLRAMDVQIALLPLLTGSLEIGRLVLIQPDILLERNVADQPNWVMTPEPRAAPQGDASPGGRRRAPIVVQAIRITDGTLAYRDGRTGIVRSLSVAKLDAAATSAESPVSLNTQATYNGTVFTLTGSIGSLDRLADRQATMPWPVDLTLSAAGATLSANGALTQPLQAKGYDVTVKGSVPDLSALTPLLPSPPPALRDVTFSAKLEDKDQPLPDVSALTLHIGASDLSARVPGLLLDRLDITAASLTQGFKADGAGKLGEMPLALAGTIGPASGSVPVDMTVRAGAAETTAKATLMAAAGGFGAGGSLHGIAISGPDADLSGDATWTLQPRASLTATLGSNRLDLDALRALSGTVRQDAGAPSAPTEPPPRTRDRRLFSDQPIGFDRLRDIDADLTLTIGTLRSGGQDYKAIRTHAGLKDGKLAIDRLSADFPQGHLNGTLSVDATKVPPPVHLSLRAPGLSLRTLLEDLHQPPFANGDLEVLADLSGAGASPHAIAASLDGSLGLAVPAGTIDNRLLGGILGKAMNDLNALDLVGRGGASALHCFGARLRMHNGVAAFESLALSSSLLTMTGGGSINLGDETLAMTLRPRVRVAGAGLVIPIQLSGPIQHPATRVNKIGAAESNAGSVAGAVIGDATPLGIIGGLFGVDKLLESDGDVCPAALAAARGEAAPAEAAKSKDPFAGPAAELRKLFR
jgi:AsmA protein